MAANLNTARPCVCGTGLSAARCCGLNLASLGSPEANRHLVPLEQEALKAQSSGNVARAERIALDVLELAPGRITPLRLLYELRKSQAKPKASAVLINRIVALDPNNFWAVNEAATFSLSKADHANALRHARNAIRIAPESAQAHYLMGMALTEMQRPSIAEYHYRRALEFSGVRDPIVLSNFALCLKNQGKMTEARALYEEALASAPDNLHLLLAYARLEEADRNLDAAWGLVDRAEKVAPRNPSIHLLRAVILGRKDNAAEALRILDRATEGDATLGVNEYMEKGRLLDRLGRFDEAFAAFDAGKTRLREASGQTYLEAHAKQRATRLKGFFNARRLKALPRARLRSEVAQPLFVLGFPRSGTTLLEQTLSAHPRIEAGDELPLIAEIAELMPRMLESPLGYPEALAELWMGDHRDDLDYLRDHYLRRAAQLGVLRDGVAWFTDKMPLNEVELGLIHLLFPRSPLLHVTRHPLDVLVSVYSNLLTHGHYCAYGLESAAKHLVLAHDLVEHYRGEMDLRYMRVRYEDLVDDQEDTVRRVLKFIGEDFDAKCLAFHENRRYARTASYAQVSEKLYDRSRYRYRHYLRHLEPVLPILRPTIEGLGYLI